MFRVGGFISLEKAAGILALLGIAAGSLVNSGAAREDRCSHFEPATGAASAANSPSVKVVTTREGNSTRFFVENMEDCEITVTFEFSATNIKDVEKPRTLVVPARTVSEAFVLEPQDPGAKWSYSYTNYYKLGSNLSRHDATALYSLPYAPGERFKVTQAYGGSFSHKGSNKYAIDWKMPEGTPVHAARGGEVVKTRDDSNTGGPSMKYDVYNNFVLIRHADGTLGHYCHLLKDSVAVKVGDRVSAGQLLAKSGNTGFSSGPHLHFCVFKTLSGKDRESVPVKFRTEAEAGTTLLAGRNYRATVTGTESASAKPKSASTVSTAAGASGS